MDLHVPLDRDEVYQHGASDHDDDDSSVEGGNAGFPLQTPGRPGSAGSTSGYGTYLIYLLI